MIEAVLAAGLVLSQETPRGANQDYCTPAETSQRAEILSEAEAVKIGREFFVQLLLSEERMEGTDPFTARLHEDVWIVRSYKDPEWVGGLYIVRIDAYRGCVLDWEIHK